MLPHPTSQPNLNYSKEKVNTKHLSFILIFTYFLLQNWYINLAKENQTNILNDPLYNPPKDKQREGNCTWSTNTSMQKRFDPYMLNKAKFRKNNVNSELKCSSYTRIYINSKKSKIRWEEIWFLLILCVEESQIHVN